MEPTHHRTCTCGAIYDCTEHMVKSREIASFEYAVCNQTMEPWNTAVVPIYRFVAGPVDALLHLVARARKEPGEAIDDTDLDDRLRGDRRWNAGSERRQDRQESPIHLF
jgi:hypothetical protein